MAAPDKTSTAATPPATDPQRVQEKPPPFWLRHSESRVLCPGGEDDKEIVGVNTDKQANILDVQLVAKMAFNLLPSHPALDINKDGTSNILDVVVAAMNSTLVEPHEVCQ